jgi:8-oxo-dGTP diphosphatase
MTVELLEYILTSERELNKYEPLAGSYAVVRCEGKYLVCFHKERNQWELPAGGREAGESPKDCAIRELSEETAQIVHDMEFKGLIKMRKLQRDTIYFPVYFATLESLSPFEENLEMNKIMLWDLKEEIGRFDEVDRQVLNFLLTK